MKLSRFNPLNAELNPICHLLALLGAHHILHVSRVRVNLTQFIKGPVISEVQIEQRNHVCHAFEF